MDKSLYTLDFMRHTYENFPIGVFVYGDDEQGEIVYTNPRMLALCDCKNERGFRELTGGSLFGMIHKNRTLLLDDIKDQLHASKDRFTLNCMIVTGNGSCRPVELAGHVEDEKTGSHLIHVFVINEKGRLPSYEVDPVTGLPGMRRFIAAAHEVVRENAQKSHPDRLYLLFFNISHFKMFNVNYGITAGDKFLKMMGESIRQVFSDLFISRFDVDHFMVLAEGGDIDRCLKEVHDMILRIRPSAKVECKIGVYELHGETLNPDLALASVKIACDSIRNTPGTFYAYYTDSMGKSLTVREYVTKNIDEAIEKEYIKAYFQPVVRTISKTLCGMEALVRWNDPVKGFLMPCDFITALEDSREIYKLDLEIIRQVCRNIALCKRSGEAIVPVSVNLSRLDFLCCDIFKEIEDLTARYRVPKELLHIEVTESVFMGGETVIWKTLKKFRAAGYEVWMDDFGSGYSSLNLLKDYKFDVLKIDMAFLSSPSKRARNILSSVVAMTKTIGGRSLAEGVETKEQFEFLKKAGCEEVQGYYFGKPAPYEETIRHCMDTGIKIESRAMRLCYEALSKVDFQNDKAPGVAEYDGKTIRLLYTKDEHLKKIMTPGCIELGNRESIGNARRMEFASAFRELAEKVLKSGHREEVSCIISNKPKIISGACIVHNNGTYAFSIKLNNLVENTLGDTDRAGQTHFDRILQNVYSVYDNITLLDLAKRTSMNLAGRGETRGKLSKTGDLGQDHVIYFETCIYPADYERYLAFTDANTLSQRVEAKGHTGLSSFFRTKDKDGTYPWKMHTIIPVSRTGASKILYCGKGLSGDCAKMVGTAQEDIEERALEAYAERGVESKDILWKSLMNFSDVACFWKDREHRIRGINSKFMKSFGLSSEKDVIGKTSDEMGWIINEYSWKRSEDDVLISGRCIRNEMVDCVFQGTLKRIIYTEIPIYDEGEIIGILGWFIEEEQIEKSRENLKLTVTDPVTELLNSRGLLESMMTYSEMYQHYNVDYVMLFIFVPQYNQMLASYGKETADELLREVTSRINSVFGRSGPVGRINGGEFILLFHYEDQGAVSDMSRKLKEEISHIDHVKNIPCKVDANTLITYGSDKIAAGKLMEQAIGIIRSGGAEISVDDWVNKGELFDRIPIPYVLLDVPIGNDGMISGIICRYKNTAYEKMMGIHNKTELEKRFSDLLDTPDYTWRQRLYEAAYEGRTVFNQKYFPEEGEWLDYLFFRGPRRGTCSAMILHRDKSTVQAAPRVLNYSTDHLVNYLMDILIKGENYGTAIGSVLKEIGIIISADRVFIGNIQNQSVSYPFSWCREGLASIKNLGFTGADFDEYVEMRKHLLEKNDSIAISDIHDIKETDRVTYQFLKAHDVHSIAEVPIFRDNHLYGFLGVINYDRENGVDVRYMLEKVAGYLDLKARNQELMDTLKYMSGNNLLTGLHNRNAMSKKVEELKLHRTPVGIIYADLNNLKATNDTYGHDAGDLRLKEIADIMKEIFDLDDIYRLGGDEFIIIMDNVKKLDKMDKLRKFKKVIRNRSVDVAIGFEWVENASEFDFGMKSADKKMYRNKKKYYKTHKLTERGDERAAAR